MKKTILSVFLFAALAVGIIIGCGDSSVQNKNPEISELLNVFTGGDTRYTLTVNVTPSNSGTASRSPSNSSYAAGSQVTVTAVESSGYRFIGWSGASNDTAATVTITMDGNQTLTANFISTSVTTYALTVNAAPSGGGNVLREPNKTRYNAGEQVTVTAEAVDGYTFIGWMGATNVTTPVITVAMNGDMTLTANFQQHTHTFSVTASPAQGGAIYRDPNKSAYSYGEQVIVTAAPAAGYTFKNWSGASSSANATINLTIDGNKTLTAIFEQQTYSLTTSSSPSNGGTVSRNPNKNSYAYGEQVTVTATPATGYAFDGYTGSVTSTSAGVTIIMDGNKTLTAGFKQQTAQSYTLSTVANPAVSAISISRTPDKASYTQGEAVTVTAPTVDGYTFTGWSGASTSTSTIITITMDGNKTLTANYSPLDYILTMEIIPAIGGTVSRNPNNDAYTYNQTVNLTATPAAGYKFTGWSGAATGTSANTTVTMNANKSLTANFEQTSYTLESYVYMNTGGTVSRSPNKDVYAHNEQVVVTAIAASGYTFTGWSGASTSTNPSVTITMNGDKTLIANFQQQQATAYTLTTNVSPSGSGSVSRSPNQTTYSPGTTVTVTATPASGNAYVFKGWSGASSSTSATVTITMDGNKTLTASFGAPEAKRFTVYFNGNGATDGANPPQAATADSGSSITLPGQQTLVKAGYSFGGWNTNNVGTGTQYAAFASYAVKGDVTLYARWVPIYTITYNGNGNTAGNIASAQADSGTAITLPGQGTLVKTGYIFGGWNTTSTGGTSYTAGSSYTVTGNVTLYAKWTIKSYTVTYNGNGTTTGVPQAVSADSGSSVTLSGQGSMARAGYTFGGWNTNISGTGTNLAASSSYTVTGNITLYAKWTIKTFTVTYNGNGTTTGVPQAVSADSGSSVTLSGQGSMARAGYTFGGWNTTSTGGTNYTAGSSYTVTGNVTLYAKWTAYPVYTVTYNGNGNTSGSVSAMSVDSGSAITLPSKGTLVKAGHNFSGWNTKSDGTGTNYNVNSSYTVTGNVTLYAKWTAYPVYTVTYNGNGTTVSVPQAVSVDSGSSVTLSGQGSMARTGYSFGGWNTNTDGTGTNYNAGASYTVTSNVTLYAKWTAVYTLTTNVTPSGGGTVSRSPNQTSYTSGTSVTVTATAASEYTFTGWSGASSSTSSSVTITMNGDKTLTANFQQQQTIPNAPTNVSATATSSSITVSWSAVTGATGYYVYRSTSASGTYSYVTSTTSTSYTNNSLSSGTTYYYKVSAYNNAGEGSQSSYGYATTTPTPTVGTFFTDSRDNKTYRKVVIGSQTWMAENLNYQPSTGNSWCYSNNTANCSTYGRLYDWATALTVCPNGWHLPSNQEWGALVTAAGGSTVAGKKLKSTSGWNAFNGTDDYGFSALPGGYRYTDGSFGDAGNYGHWWTATEYSVGYAYNRLMDYYNDVVYNGYGDEENGLAVRCVED